MERFGIDIGRVIIGPTVDGVADTSFLGRTVAEAMHTLPAQGSFEVITRLVARTRGQVWLVSKCGPSVEKKTLAWLAHTGFHTITGMPPGHVHFVRKRHQKAEPAGALGLTHFIDDRVDVLQHLRGLVPNLYLFGEDNPHPPGWVQPVRNWEEVERVLG